jgi:hypothetical protein
VPSAYVLIICEFNFEDQTVNDLNELTGVDAPRLGVLIPMERFEMTLDTLYNPSISNSAVMVSYKVMSPQRLQ